MRSKTNFNLNKFYRRMRIWIKNLTKISLSVVCLDSNVYHYSRSLSIGFGNLKKIIKKK